ncbi:MAG: MobF family relaxase [Rhodoferax sp.]|uniref:MobF family relaxase n=1 Tax=Rhodoferax sp. TaxID=50421 RepID=UPI002716ED9D|nr:MobF family relaxase [Rhodoferax sp.]MDO8451104.1 MobF family relaxase [Rhodoferax sp.]
MLTLAKVTNSDAAANYYETADDYYAEGGRAPSAWWGDGAKALGLAGPVDAADFKTLLDGNLPDGQQMHRGGEGERTAGLDLTFSAPKSVSMQALVAGDLRLLDAHEKAVDRTLTYIESTLAAYRNTVASETQSIASGNIITARFQHDLSRETDPQLHSHCVVLNMTQRDDEQWRALDAKPFYEQQKLLGTYYRAELAREVQLLGFAIRMTHHDGRFELAHINDAQVAAFSSRSQAITQALAARGKDRSHASAHEKELANLNTRQRKSKNIDRVALRFAWRDKALALGIDWTPLPVWTLTDAQRRETIEAAVRFAVEHLTERQSVVGHDALVSVALGSGTGVADLKDITNALHDQVSRGELVQTVDGKRYTTTAAQQREREIMAIEARGRNVLRFGLHETYHARAILGAAGLTVGQRAAAELILSTRNRVVAVQGLAGTGKTHMLRTVQEKASLPWKIMGLAPSAAAARELEGAGITAQTVAAFLARNGGCLNINTLVVLDEAGMVSTRDMHSVLTVVENAGARIVLVGDTQQLKAVEAGRPFAQLQAAGMTVARMSDIQRQTNAVLRQAVQHAATGAVRDSLALLAPKIAEVAHSGDRHAQIARHYAALQPEQQSDTLIVAGTNSARASINDMVRQQLGLAGNGMMVTILERQDLTQAQLKSSLSYSAGDIVQVQRHYDSIGLRRGDLARVVTAEPGCITMQREDGAQVTWRPTAMPHVAVFQEAVRELAVGDRVRFTANDYGHQVINGDTGIVKAVDSDGGRVHIEKADGSLVALDSNAPLHLDHGYCTTVHAAQGQTCERVLVDADIKSAMASESLYYVAISRARNEVAIYTDDRELLPEAMTRKDEKLAALDIKPQREWSLG